MSETEMVREAWDEVASLRAFIRTLEWAGTAVVDYDGVTASACPSCGGLKPDQAHVWDYKACDFGHQPGCELVEALAPRFAKGTPP